MKILRVILVGLGVMIVLLGMLVAVAFIPEVQTWYAQKQLDAQKEVRGTVGSLSAGFSHVEIADLHLETQGAVIDVPSLQATLPVRTAAWDGKFQFRRLVAKGWTIDFSRALSAESAATSTTATPASGNSPAGENPAQAETAAVQDALKVLRSFAGGRALPYDLALDGVELEGDVVFVPPGQDSVRMHLVIKGGGLVAGHEGVFAVDADTVGPWPGIRTMEAHGQMSLVASSPRRLDRIALKADVSIRSLVLPDNFIVSTEMAVARGAVEETYSLGLSREGRFIVNVLARSPDATRELAGDWRVNLSDGDLALLAPNHVWPGMAVAGEGQFAADPAMTRLQVRGRLNTVADSPGNFVPLLAGHGAVTVATHFKFEWSGRIIRFAELGATLTGDGPVVTVQAREPFEFDGKTSALKSTEPSGEWMDGSVRDLPLGWVSALPAGLHLVGGNVAGDFVIRIVNGGFALRPKAPFAVAGVSVQQAGRTFARDLDLSLAWLADGDARGWQVQCAPLAVSRAGRRLVTVEAKASRQAGTDRTILVKGTWQADLAALAALPEMPAQAKFTAQSAAGEFTANMGQLSEVEGKVTVIGHDPKHTLTVSVNADQNSEGKWTFQIPVKMESGSQVTDLSAEGSWFDASTGGRSYVRVTGEKVDIAQLHQLLGPLAALAGASTVPLVEGVPPVTREKDRVPFWGKGQGTVVVEFDQLRAGNKIYRNVGGSIEVDPGSLRLNHGRGAAAQQTPLQLDGVVTFEAAEEFPYRLKADGDFGEVNAATIWPVVPDGPAPQVEGRFTLAGTLTGHGRTPGDLLDRTQMDFKLAGTKGIIRILKTNIGDGLPQDKESSEMGDTLNGVGTLVGKLFALKKGSGEKSVNPTTENVLNLSSIVGEIGYDTLIVTGRRSADGAIQVSQIIMLADNERLQGNGEITASKGQTLAVQPLRLDLRLGVRGDVAALFAQAGLLSGAKDKDGFTNLSQPLRFDGRLAKIDSREWHDLLVKAATRTPAVKK